MGISVEKRLTKLENEIKALKATYAVYGGKAKTYYSVSPWFDVRNVRQIFKFKADYVDSGKILVASIQVSVQTNDGTIFPMPSYAMVVPQTGDGSITIRFPAAGVRCRLAIVCTSPGTFTQIA